MSGPPNMQLPPITATQNAVARTANAAARHASGEKPAQRVSEEIQHAATCGCPQCKAGGRAPAPVTAQKSQVAEALAKRANERETGVTVGAALVDQEMTLDELAQLVGKQKRGVTEVVQADISEAADWTPGEGGPLVVSRGTSQSGSDLTRKMLRTSKR